MSWVTGGQHQLARSEHMQPRHAQRGLCNQLTIHAARHPPSLHPALTLLAVKLPPKAAAAVQKHRDAGLAPAITTLDEQGPPSAQNLAALRSMPSRHAIKTGPPAAAEPPARRGRAGMGGLGSAGGGDTAQGGTLRALPAVMGGDTTLSLDVGESTVNVTRVCPAGAVDRVLAWMQALCHQQLLAAVCVLGGAAVQSAGSRA